MQKRVLIALGVLLVAIVGVTEWQVWPPREPVYQGMRLTDWLLTFRAHETSAMTAVKQMGTNALPTLLRLIRKKDSPLLLKALRLAQNQHLVMINHIPARDWNNMGAQGFFLLGHTADCAAPALVEIYESNVSPESRSYVLEVLGTIGPPAKRIVPSLLPQTTDPDEYKRFLAVWALAQIHCDPELVVPVLIKALHDPVSSIRENAAIGLGVFGHSATQAVPALVESLKDQNSAFRDTVSSSLRSIDPEAAAKAGVK